MKTFFPALLASALLLAAAPMPVKDAAAAEGRRKAPRIIYGESQGATFEFDELRLPRRVNPGPRQAYFGSGAAYSEALTALRDNLQAIVQRERLARQPQSPARKAAEGGMPPALQRALALAEQARREAGTTTD